MIPSKAYVLKRISEQRFFKERRRTHGATYEEAIAPGIETLELLAIAYQASKEPLLELGTVCAIDRLVYVV